MFLRIGKPAWAACVIGLCGCDFFSERTLEPRPSRLRPEIDAFAYGVARTYAWSEGEDSLWLASPAESRLITVQFLGDTTIAGQTLRRLGFAAGDGDALPAAVISCLGFTPSLLVPDSTVSDPGPDLGFPEYPQIGWRREITAGDLRFVRVLRGEAVLNRSEGLIETWEFVDSVYWDQQPVTTATLWLGRRGLLLLRAQWGSGNSGRWRREISAL